MLFEQPIPFEEALASRKVKALLPTTLSSKELHEIAPEIKERAMFSARTANASYLQTIDDVIGQILDPKQVQREENPEGETTTEGMNLTQARVTLKDALDSISYVPEADKEGTIEDLSSDKRLEMVIQTNGNMAAGYGHWAQMQDQDILDEFPAQELYRAEGRKVPREWLERWQEVGGELFEGDRMIALMNDEIWQRLGSEFDDGLGNPYPPFAFNSGMDVKPVDREEAESFGLIKPNESVVPEDKGFDEVLESSPDLKSAALKESLLATMPGYKFDGDVLTKANESLANAFNPDQPRDETGKWTSGRLSNSGIDKGLEALKKMPAAEYEEESYVSFPKEKYSDKAAEKLRKDARRLVGWPQPQALELSKLHRTQDYIVRHSVAGIMERLRPEWIAEGAERDQVDMAVEVVKKGGVHYLMDGHHRATAALLSGAKTIQARIFNLDKDVANAFDPAEPRDESGKWTSGASADEKIVYHGTVEAFRKDVLEKGLQVNKNRIWHSDFYKEDRADKVFVTTSKRAAEYYSDWARGEMGRSEHKAIVLEAHIPKADWDKLAQKDMKTKEESFMLPFVKPEWIKEIHTDMKKFLSNEAEDVQVVYITVQIHVNSDLSNAGDNCGTGSGGFQPGNHCSKGSAKPDPEPTLSASARAYRTGDHIVPSLNGVPFKPVEMDFEKIKEGKFKEPDFVLPEPSIPHEPWFDQHKPYAIENINAVAKIRTLAESGQIKDIEELPKSPSGRVEDYKRSVIRALNGESDKHIASGAVISEPDGRIWLVQPKNGYGGYKFTFPKGTLERGLSLQQNAHKEIHEESGLAVKLTGFLGDYEGDTSHNRFYVGVRRGGSPVAFKTDETEAVRLVSLDDAEKLLKRARDQKILGDYRAKYAQAQLRNAQGSAQGESELPQTLANEATQAAQEPPGATFTREKASQAAAGNGGGLPQTLGNQQSAVVQISQEAVNQADTPRTQRQHRLNAALKKLKRALWGWASAAQRRPNSGSGPSH